MHALGGGLSFLAAILIFALAAAFLFYKKYQVFQLFSSIREWFCVCGMSEEGEDWKWDNKPLRGWVFSNNSEEIDCQCGSLLSLFWFMSSFETKFTFTSCDVNVNSVQ